MFSDALALVRLHELEFGLDTECQIAPERVETEIRRCRSEVSPAMLAKYEQLKVRFGSGALAEMENGICSACRISLPRTLINRLKGNVTLCDHCGRILYNPDHVYQFRY